MFARSLFDNYLPQTATTADPTEQEVLPHARQLRLGFRSLRFEPQIEAEYLDEAWGSVRVQTTIGLMLAFAVVVFFGIKDAVANGTWSFSGIVVVRFFFILPVLALTALAINRVSRRNGELIISVVIAVLLSAYVAAYVFSQSQNRSLDFSSVLAPLYFTYLVFGLRFRVLLVSTAPILPIYLLSLSVADETPSSAVSDFLYLAFAQLQGFAAVYMLDYSRRRSFLLERLARFRADHDPLTMSLNRRAFATAADHVFRQAFRESRSVSVYIVDIDHFKKYNDTYGHGRGDICIQKVAAAISSCMRRPLDVVARFGGEEFVLLGYDLGQPDSDSKGSEIVDSVRALNIEHKKSKWGAVSVSVGYVACAPVSGSCDLERLLEQADKALYAAKERGRNQAVSAADDCEC